MMGSKREEERNEKIIRGLMKLPPNRRCINCNCVGPQYVCTNFWTFVCSTCSGIHREFTHRVKSVSMSKFSTQEVNALQQGGNQRARDIYLKNWDMTRMRLPESSNADRIRDFIRSVYVNKKYFAEKPSEKTPTDIESPMANENDLRRPSSYHSFSQSPPYDYQYEERRYGKNLAPAPKRLGSELGGYTGKISSFGSQSVHEDRFANERSSGSRFSDFSGPQRTSSSGSFGSFDDNVHEQPVGGANQLVVSSLMSSSYLPPLVKPTQQIDLFAGFNEQNVPTKPGPAAVSPNQVQTNKPGPAATNAPSEVQVQTNKPVPVPVNAQSQVQTNKPGPTVNNVPAQVQTNKPGPVATNAPSQVKTSKPVPSVDLFAGFDNQQQDWANFDSPQKEQVVAKPSVQPSPVVVPAAKPNVQPSLVVAKPSVQPSPVVVPAAKPNVQPSLVVAKPSVQPSVQSSPVVVATGDDLMRGGMGPVTVHSAVVPPQIVHATVPTNQERSQAWNAFGESSGNINQVVSAPSVQLSPLNELVVPLLVPVPVPVQGTYTPVPAPTQINAHALALAPTNQNQLEPWNAFGESRGTINQFNAQVNSVPSAQMSALVPVGTNIPEGTGTQIPLQSTMSLRDNNVPTNLSFPQSWNANENTVGNMPVNNVYGNIPLNNLYPIHSLPENRPYDQQYIGHIFSKGENYPSMDTVPPNMNAPVPTSFHSLQGMMPPHRTKSTNPFDFPEESDIQPNNNMYMDMSSLQAALPAQQAPSEFYSNSSFATQYYSPNPQSTMQYMSGGQGPTPQSSYPSLGGNPFA